MRKKRKEKKRKEILREGKRWIAVPYSGHRFFENVVRMTLRLSIVAVIAPPSFDVEKMPLAFLLESKRESEMMRRVEFPFIRLGFFVLPITLTLTNCTVVTPIA